MQLIRLFPFNYILGISIVYIYRVSIGEIKIEPAYENTINKKSDKPL